MIPFHRSSRRAFVIGGIALAAPTVLAQPTRMTLRFAIDWLPQVNHAFVILALRRGYFAEEGITATVDRGFGSGRTMTDLASGIIQMGLADIPTAIAFALRNPQVGVRAIGVIYDGSPLVVTVDALGPLQTPREIAGKRLAAPEGDAGRQMFPAFARAVGIDPRTVEWINVTPQLREAMLARGEAQGITGFITSTQMGLEALGWPAARIRHFRYRDFGLPLFSSGIVTTERFLRENPELARASLRAMYRGLQHHLRDVEDAIAAVREHESLTDPATERRRWLIVRDEMLLTEHVRRNGLSAVDEARVATNISIVKEAFGISSDLRPDSFWDPSYLPGRQLLTIPANLL